MFLHTIDDIYHRQKQVRNKKLFHIITAAVIIALVVSNPQHTNSISKTLADSLNSAGVIYFDFGKYELKPESYSLLNKLAEEIKSDPGAKLEIVGHTDNIGSESFNDGLALKRAEEVQVFLFLRNVKSSQVTVRSEGFRNPAADNENEEHRAMNRRVEFRWIKNSIAVEKHVEEKDESFVNAGGSWKQNGNELIGEISVRDTSGEPITDVTDEDVKAELHWEEKGEKQQTNGTVKLLPIDDKKKIAFTFTMDYSGSMFSDSLHRDAKKSDRINQMEKAVLTFIDNMNNNFYGRIIKFGFEIRELVRYTRSKNALKEAVVNYTENLFGTALYRSIWHALKDTTFNSNPTIMKTVIAFTDGEENSSGNISKNSIYDLTDKTGVKVYTIGLLDEAKHSVPVGMKGWGEADLVEIARRTGGFYYWAKDPSVLPLIYKQIYDQIMKSYNVSIMWNSDKLPAKGTNVTAMLRINVRGMYRTIYKNYVME